MSKREKLVEADWPRGKVCKIAIVGEAPGLEEALAGRPFVGSSGKLLDSLLVRAGIDRAACLVTNVFTKRPPKNDVKWFFAGKSKKVPEGVNHVPHNTHGWLKPEWWPELERLKEEIVKAEPNIVLALGATAIWALTGHSTITKYRGTVLEGSLVPHKVLGTYHPAYLMRNWSDSYFAALDIIKAKRHSEAREIHRPSREIWVDPTLEDLYEFERLYMADVARLAYDIETDPWETMLLRCIGFSPSPLSSVVVPFFDRRKPGWSYWPTAEQEQEAWRWVHRHLSNPDTVKIAQNGYYDQTWLETYGIKVRGPTSDTLLLSHALQPELKKDLGTLGSVYTDEAAWKGLMGYTVKEAKDV